MNITYIHILDNIGQAILSYSIHKYNKISMPINSNLNYVTVIYSIIYILYMSQIKEIVYKSI